MPSVTPRQRTENASLSQSVVTAVAEREGVDPTELTPPLFDVVDPDALDAVFTDATSDAHASFTYCGYEVVAHADGRVTLSPSP